MDSLSVVIITCNEEANIGRCLKSVAWADEIIVVDSGSTDDTREIAGEMGAAVYDLEFEGYGPAKAYGVTKATSRWVLSVDADEAVSPELAAEIREVLDRDTAEIGFDMPRRTNFLGRWIYHCGWYPDRILRLFRRDRGGFNDARVHESISVEGAVGHLKGELLHYSYPTLEHYLRKSNRYTTLGARQAFKRGRRTSWIDLVFRPPVSFISHFISRQGFRDGMEGLLISVLSAVAVLVKYAKLRDLARREGHIEDDGR